MWIWIVYLYLSVRDTTSDLLATHFGLVSLLWLDAGINSVGALGGGQDMKSLDSL